MNPLGERLMVALAEQGWLVVFARGYVLIAEPLTDVEVVVPEAWFVQEDEYDLAMTIVSLAVVYGLIWPWPPEPSERVAGHG